MRNLPATDQWENNKISGLNVHLALLLTTFGGVSKLTTEGKTFDTPPPFKPTELFVLIQKKPCIARSDCLSLQPIQSQEYGGQTKRYFPRLFVYHVQLSKKRNRKMGLFIKKPFEALLAEANASGSKSLKRVLGPWSLVALGVGVIIRAALL